MGAARRYIQRMANPRSTDAAFTSLWRVNGQCLACMAQETGLSMAAIYRRARKLGLPGGQQHNHYRMRDGETVRRDFLACDSNVARLARLYGISRQRAHQLVVQHVPGRLIKQSAAGA